MWGRDTLQGDSTSLRSVPAPPIVSCVPATAGTCIQRAPPPTQDESTSDSEALDLFRRKPYKPITFLTIIQEPFLSEPIRIIIPIFFSAVVALVIVARDTENFCIICLSVILSFSTMALKIICCLLDSWERRIVSFSVSFSVSFTVSFRNSDIVGESADAPVDRSRIPSLLKLYAVSFHCVPVQQAFYAYQQCHRSIIFANLMILLQNLQQIVEFGHGLGFDGVHQRSLYCLKKPLYVIFAINPHFFANIVTLPQFRQQTMSAISSWRSFCTFGLLL